MKIKRNTVFVKTRKRLSQVSPQSSQPKKPVRNQKSEHPFSESRDVREDRGTRQMKTTHKARTFPHKKTAGVRKKIRKGNLNVMPLKAVVLK